MDQDPKARHDDDPRQDRLSRLGWLLPGYFIGLFLAGAIAAAAYLWFQPVAPTLPDERVERPGHGFAVSFPANWEYVDASMPNAVTWWDPAKVDVGERHKRFLADGGVLMARQAAPPAEDFCDVYDLTDHAAMAPAWTTLGDAARFYRTWEDDLDATSLDIRYLELPAGRTLTVDVLWRDGSDQRRYLFSDGTSWFGLYCEKHLAPDDRWLSIAETFLFLPQEESIAPMVHEP